MPAPSRPPACLTSPAARRSTWPSTAEAPRPSTCYCEWTRRRSTCRTRRSDAAPFICWFVLVPPLRLLRWSMAWIRKAHGQGHCCCTLCYDVRSWSNSNASTRISPLGCVGDRHTCMRLMRPPLGLIHPRPRPLACRATARCMRPWRRAIRTFCSWCWTASHRWTRKRSTRQSMRRCGRPAAGRQHMLSEALRRRCIEECCRQHVQALFRCNVTVHTAAFLFRTFCQSKTLRIFAVYRNMPRHTKNRHVAVDRRAAGWWIIIPL